MTDSARGTPETTSATRQATASTTARARARAELTDVIKTAARRHVREHGASALSLRAVAREVGMVSSAVYRYYPSRDELLTALIIDAYSAVGAVAEAAARDRRGFVAQWVAVAEAVRSWALEAPHEYALIYGSPVPGYEAPVDTVDPAARVPLVLLRLLADAVASGEVRASGNVVVPRAVRHDFAALRSGSDLAIPDAVLARGIAAWSQLFGSISLEMFGHLNNVISDYDALFRLQMRQCADYVAAGSYDATTTSRE